jgi:hypothetical protein
MKIQIICSSPGMFRNGTRHPASAFYDEGHWSDQQLAAFQADPAFTIREVDDAAENVNTDADFALAVANEVDRQVAEKKSALQGSFDTAVKEAVADAVAAIKADAETASDDAAKQLKAANDKIADLEAQLKAAPKPATTKPVASKK